MIAPIKPLVVSLSLATLAFGMYSFGDGSSTNILGEQGNILKIGDKAPDLAYKNPAGSTISLSDLQGKIVLLHFWGSFAEGSKRENPNVVRLYQKYKTAKFQNDATFDVFSVSLDKNEADWKNGIKNEGLVWKNHVSDLQFWKSAPAQTYNVNSIPALFLLDENGIIIAKGLSVSQVQGALDKKIR